IAEPAGRDTAPCIGFAAERLAAQGAADDVMLVCPADHVIRPAARFHEAARRAAELAAAGSSLVTLGVPPRWPSTAFGYIRRGERLAGAGTPPAYRAASFEEKPPAERAQELLAAGDWLWNSGIFAWKVSTIREAIRSYFPELAAGLDPLGALLRERV